MMSWLDSRHPPSRTAFVAAIFATAAVSACGSNSPGSSASCSLPTAASLTVVQVTPPSNASGVFLGASVSVRFNTCLDVSTITSMNFHLASLGFVAGSLSYDAPTATVTFKPTSNLAYDTLYLFGVTGPKGAHGELLAVPFGSAFTTQAVPDAAPPTTAALPPGGFFNSTQSVTLNCADNVGGTGCAATYYTLNGATPTTLSTRYTAPVAIATSATLRFFSVDAQGNAEAPKQETYVIDKVPPTLTSSDPANGTAGVSVARVITATFSEAMKATSFTPTPVTVDNGVTVTLSYTAATNTLTIAPTERLACNTTYHVAIGGGATDLAGNGLVQPATFSFTTTSDCVEPVTTASVSAGVYKLAQSVTLTCTDGGGSGCARIVYTTDGTVPSLDPPANGTIISGTTAGPISVGAGDTTLRYFSEDAAGNREALRQQLYSISTTGFTFVATDEGLARGVGPVPASFVTIRPGGRTSAFFRDPSNNRLYRGTELGLLFSDGGEAWTFAPASLPWVISVLAEGSKIFAGTTAGLLVSIDGGATFATRSLGVNGAGYVRTVIASGDRVYAATDSGVAVSADKGQTFTMRTKADGLGSVSVRGLVLAGSTLYAATGGGVSISTDGGTTFTNYASGLASPSVNAIAVTGNTVYAGTDGGLCVSPDAGHSYVVKATTANGLGSNYVDQLVLAGTKLYLGTGESWFTGTKSFAISPDGGTNFTFPLVAPKTDPGLHVGSIFVDVDGTTVRVGAYPAYYLSVDGGTSFVPKDLRGALKRVTGSGTNLYMAVEDSSGHGGVAVSTDRGQSFTIRGLENGLLDNSVADVFATGSNVYAATGNGVGFSTDGGTTFVNHALSTAANAGCVYASGTTVWAGSGALEKSTSGGAFASVKAGTGGGQGIAASGTNFYLATWSGLWVSNDSGATFSLKDATKGLANTGLSGVAVDFNGTVLAVSNSSGGPNGFYLSTDNGATFTALGTTMFPNGVYASGTTWYASTYSGLGISTDGGATWTWRGATQGLQGKANGAWYMP